VYTPDVVRSMVEQKRQASGRPTNLLYERDRLKIAIAAAMDKGPTVLRCNACSRRYARSQPQERSLPSSPARGRAPPLVLWSSSPPL